MTEEDRGGMCEFPLLLLLAVTKPAAEAEAEVVAVLW